MSNLGRETRPRAQVAGLTLIITGTLEHIISCEPTTNRNITSVLQSIGYKLNRLQTKPVKRMKTHFYGRLKTWEYEGKKK